MVEKLKRIEINNKFYRIRRGKLVEIPKKWVDNITHHRTIRHRQSKLIHKIRSMNKMYKKNHTEKYMNLKYAISEREFL